MAQVIGFHVPERFRRQARWTPPSQRGRVLEFNREYEPVSGAELIARLSTWTPDTGVANERRQEAR